MIITTVTTGQNKRAKNIMKFHKTDKKFLENKK